MEKKVNKYLFLGVYQWSDGRSYSGQWKKNQMHGKGEFKWPNQIRYVGEYKVIIWKKFIIPFDILINLKF